MKPIDTDDRPQLIEFLGKETYEKLIAEYHLKAIIKKALRNEWFFIERMFVAATSSEAAKYGVA